MNTKEEWRDIEGFEGYYQVSDLGRVKSLSRVVIANCNGGTKLTKEKILKPISNKFGHIVVNLSKLGKVKGFLTHRLVLETFVGPCPDGMQCCHGVGGILDNSLENISWGTRYKNQGEDRLRDGTDNRGTKNGQNKLTQSQVLEIYERAWQGEPQKELGEEFGVQFTCVSSIKHGRIWSWLTHEVKNG